MYRVLGKLKEITREQVWPYTMTKEGWKIKLPINTNGFLYRTICQHLLKQIVQKKFVTPHLLYPVRYKAEHVYQFKLPFDIFGLFGKKKSCGKKKEVKGPTKKQECKKKGKKKCKTDLKKSCLKRKKPQEKGACKKEEKKEKSCKKEEKKKHCKKAEKKKSSEKKKESSCGKKKESSCGKKKESPCGKKKESPSGKKKESPCGKKKESPCGKKKESPCGKKKESPCGEKKESSCGKKKESPCGKKKESPRGKKKESPCGKKKESPCGKKKESPCGKKKESPCGKKKSPCSSFSEVVPAESALWRFSLPLGLTLPASLMNMLNIIVKFWNKNSPGFLAAFNNTSVGPNLVCQSDNTLEQSSTVIKDHNIVLFAQNPFEPDQDLLADCKKDTIDKEVFREKIKIPCLRKGKCINPQNLPTSIDDAYLNNEKFPFKKSADSCYINELKKIASTCNCDDPCANKKLFLNELLGGFLTNFETGFRINMIPKAEVGICNNDGGECSQLNNMNDAIVYYGRKVNNDQEERLADCKDDTIETEVKREKFKMNGPCIVGEVSHVDDAYLKENKRRFPFKNENKKCYINELKKIANNTSCNDPCSNNKL